MIKPILEIKNLSKRYHQHKVLDGINACWGEGEIIGIIGNNGVGKTTLIKSCLDLLTYDGEITYFNCDLHKMGKAEKVRTFSALLEGNRNLYWKLTAIENVKYFAALRGISYSCISEITEHLFVELQLYDKRNQLVENLSRGMQQKIAFVITIVLDTPVIFLDEPTLGVDIESKNYMIDFLLKSDYFSDKLVLVTSHDLYFIQTIATSVYKLKNGHLELKGDASSTNRMYIFRVLGDEQIVKRLLVNRKVQKKGIFCEFDVDLNEQGIGDIIQLLADAKVDIVSIENVKFNMEYFYYNQ